MEQSELIKAARELLEPTPLKKGKIPIWFSKKITKFAREHNIDNDLSSVCWYISEQLGINNPWWIDHWGAGRDDRYNNTGICFISEPYGIGTDDLRLLDSLCDSMDISYYISANSYHFPGKTIRIVICEEGR